MRNEVNSVGARAAAAGSLEQGVRSSVVGRGEKWVSRPSNLDDREVEKAGYSNSRAGQWREEENPTRERQPRYYYRLSRQNYHLEAAAEGSNGPGR